MKFAIFQVINGKPVFMQFLTEAWPLGLYHATSTCFLYDTREEADKAQTSIHARTPDGSPWVHVLEVPDDVADIRKARKQRGLEIDAQTKELRRDMLFVRGHELGDMDKEFTRRMAALAEEHMRKAGV